MKLESAIVDGHLSRVRVEPSVEGGIFSKANRLDSVVGKLVDILGLPDEVIIAVRDTGDLSVLTGYVSETIEQPGVYRFTNGARACIISRGPAETWTAGVGNGELVETIPPATAQFAQ